MIHTCDTYNIVIWTGMTYKTGLTSLAIEAMCKMQYNKATMST